MSLSRFYSIAQIEYCRNFIQVSLNTTGAVNRTRKSALRAVA
jgi:hypothetical protein